MFKSLCNILTPPTTQKKHYVQMGLGLYNYKTPIVYILRATIFRPL